MRELHVRKRDLRDARIVDVAAPALADGAARLRVNRFALTANNVTYAAMGEGALGYWDFFPGPEGVGKLPCWGFATVVESNAPGVDVGARFYGYYPVAETLDVTPLRVRPHGFTDGAPHRAAKAPIYNHYVNLTSDPAYDAAYEPEQALFRALYPTGWWAADCLRLGEPRTVVVSSASAKTALATAHRLRQLGDVELVGLTSPGNERYVRETGLYQRTLTYDAVGSLEAEHPAAYVDFLGREELVLAVHRALGPRLTRSLLVGATDWAGKDGGVKPLEAPVAGPTPEFFFVPAYAAGRLKVAPELGAAMLGDLRAFYAASRAYVTARTPSGGEAIVECWSRLVAGSVPPREGLVPSFV